MQQLTIDNLKENVQSVEIRLNEQWYQEDIKRLFSLIATLLEKAQLLEQILGADKETFRLQWKNYELTLNFEVYSQSIWFEKIPTGIEENIDWKKQLISYLQTK